MARFIHIRRLLWIGLGLAGIWLLGLFVFVWSINQGGTEDYGPKADGIVVFAGGEGRIVAGIEALNNGRGTRLLISGVDPELDNRTILSAFEGIESKQDCCVDLGRKALDTRGNVLESLEWVEKWGFQSLILITANYHLPRSMAEFGCYGGRIRIIPQGVDSPARLGVLATEYSKYLVSLVRPCAS